MISIPLTYGQPDREPDLLILSELPRAAQLLGEDAAKTTKFAEYLREVFHPTTEPMTMEVAAATLGHLVRSGGAPTADIVETEVGQHPCADYLSQQWRKR